MNRAPPESLDQASRRRAPQYRDGNARQAQPGAGRRQAVVQCQQRRAITGTHLGARAHVEDHGVHPVAEIRHPRQHGPGDRPRRLDSGWSGQTEAGHAEGCVAASSCRCPGGRGAAAGTGGGQSRRPQRGAATGGPVARRARGARIGRSTWWLRLIASLRAGQAPGASRACRPLAGRNPCAPPCPACRATPSPTTGGVPRLATAAPLGGADGSSRWTVRRWAPCGEPSGRGYLAPGGRLGTGPGQLAGHDHAEDQADERDPEQHGEGDGKRPARGECHSHQYRADQRGAQ
jgi:hypothetical protein